MAPGREIDGDEAGEQDERAGERSRLERVKIEDCVDSGFDDGRGCDRVGRVGEHGDDDLKNAQGFMSARMLRRGLGVGIRGKSGQAGEKESSEAHVA